jgi:hypothetical protein
MVSSGVGFGHEKPRRAAGVSFDFSTTSIFTGWGITTMPTIFCGYVADIELVDGYFEG